MTEQYMQRVEQEFRERSAENYKGKRGTNMTDTSCVLLFLWEHPERVWWWSWEFIGQHTRSERYLSHRAPARASDLALHDGHLVEDRKVGRFKMYRIRLEHENLIKARLGIE